jgi:hypothetical protein
MIQWYRDGVFPIDRFVQYFDVSYPEKRYMLEDSLLTI